MSFFGIHIVTDAHLAALKAGGHEVEAFALTEAQKAALVLAKEPTLIAPALAAFNTVRDPSLSGPQKMGEVAVELLPVVEKIVAGGGFAGILTELKDIALAALQMIFNDTKSTTAGVAATAVLKAAGVA